MRTYLCECDLFEFQPKTRIFGTQQAWRINGKEGTHSLSVSTFNLNAQIREEKSCTSERKPVVLIQCVDSLRTTRARDSITCEVCEIRLSAYTCRELMSIARFMCESIHHPVEILKIESIFVDPKVLFLFEFYVCLIDAAAVKNTSGFRGDTNAVSLN